MIYTRAYVQEIFKGLIVATKHLNVFRVLSCPLFCDPCEFVAGLLEIKGSEEVLALHPVVTWQHCIQSSYPDNFTHHCSCHH